MFRSLAAAGVVLVVATPAAAQQSLLWSSTLTAASFEIPVDDGLTIAYVGYVQGKEGRFGRLGDPDFDFRGITHAFRLYRAGIRHRVHHAPDQSAAGRTRASPLN